jgi:tetraacyldisaccharide 4'-kinase
MNFRRLLYPFSIIFILVSEIRTLLFRINFLKKHSLDCKVISVGNLCAGGTGKTPFVNGLIELLSPHFNHICVISRGYGRKSKGPIIVSLKGELRTTVSIAGDESYMIAKRYQNISVIVAEKRILAYNLVKHENPDLVILDDAYQNQYINRDLNILLMNGKEPYLKDFVLPAGNLRELHKNINRADCIIETKFKSNLTYSYKNCFYLPYKKLNLQLNNSNIILVSGIAKPELFEELIDNLNITYREHLKFRDHHSYSTSNFKNINPKAHILTTEKDYYKLLELKLINEISFLELNFDFPKNLNNYIKNEILT